MPGQGSRRAVGLLRLPGRTLEAPQDYQPHRIDVRHHSATPAPHQGLWLAARQLDHDVQARSGSTEEMATTQRTPTHRASLGRKTVRQRSYAGRRLENLKTRLSTISHSLFEFVGFT